MKKTTGEKALLNIVKRAQQDEYDRGIVAYAFFDIKKNAFISDKTMYGMDCYTGDLEDAHIVDTRLDACVEVPYLDNQEDIAIIPLVDTIFGLSPKPGWVENELDEID